MKALFQKTIDFILYSNIFIGVCAVALTLTNELTVDGEIRFNDSCWFIFASTVFTYSYLKAGGGKNIFGTGHRDWAAQHSQLSKNIQLLSLIATACFFVLLPHQTKLIVAGLAVFTAFYGFFSIPFIKPKTKLRDFGILKTLFVALVWSVTTVIVPLHGSNLAADMMVFLLLRRFLFIVALTLVFEIKDLGSDLKSGLKTVPMLAGVANTKLLAQFILFALIIINVVQYFFFDISLLNMLAVNLSVLVSIVCIQPLKEETPERWYYLIIDGMMILQFVFVYLATSYSA